MTDTTAPTTAQTVDHLRNAAAWLRHAADHLEAGDTTTAGQMAHLGRFALEGADHFFTDQEATR